jgi:hypothetical protein
MISIDKFNLDSLHFYLLKSNIDEHQLKKIVKCYEKLKRNLADHYKFGSNWIDMWFIKLRIKKLNQLLKPYNITIQ